MWMSHWGLTRDPFADRDSPYVSLTYHDEAVARLVFAVEAAELGSSSRRRVGWAKRPCVRQLLAQSIQLRRRFVSVSCPRDGTSVFMLLAEALANASAASLAGWSHGEHSNARFGWHRCKVSRSSSPSTIAMSRLTRPRAATWMLWLGSGPSRVRGSR